MRRSLVFVSLVIALVFGLGAFGDTPRVLAQDATPAAAVELSPLLQAWVDAFNAKDSAAIAALYTDDGIVEDVPTGMVAQGRDEIEAFSRQAAAGPSDFQLEIVAAHESADFAVLEYRFSSMEMGTETPVTVRGVYVFEFEGDRISRTVDYFDVAGILIQLGLLDMEAIMAGMATPAP